MANLVNDSILKKVYNNYMRKIKNIVNTLLLILFVFSVGVSLAALLFVKNNSNFNFKDLLNIEKSTSSNPLEKNINKEVTKRVVVLEENAVIDVIEKSSPAVVSIVSDTVSLDPFRGFVQQENGIGTGFLVGDNYVFTNKHVVAADLTYKVVLNDGETTYDVLEKHLDPLNDFAILKIDNQGKKLPKLNLGDSDNLRVGQTVIAIGNALGEFSNTASKGIISGIGRSIVAGDPFGSTELLDDVIQTDAALNPGNSGGPLLDLSGNVIGINVARSEGGENLGFSIPVNAIKAVYESFLETGEIQRPYLGIRYSLNTEESSALNRVPVGAIVFDVLPDTPAKKAGLKKFDVILEVDGEKVTKKNSLAKIIARKKVGQEITLKIDREGKQKEIKLVLEPAK